jgi:hypothetical protein
LPDTALLLLVACGTLPVPADASRVSPGAEVQDDMAMVTESSGELSITVP